MCAQSGLLFAMPYWGMIFLNGVFALFRVQLAKELDSPVFREQVGHFIRRLRDGTSPLFRSAQLFLYNLRPVIWVPFHEVFL